MKFLADIEVEEGLKDSSGDLGSNGQILSSTGTGTNWIAAGGGGGSIGGATVTNQVAFGAASSTTDITSNSTFTFIKTGTGSSANTLLEVGDGDSSDDTSKGSVFITAKQVDDSTSRARFQLETSASPGSGTELRGYLQCSGTSSDVTLLSVNNLVLSGGAKVTIDGGSTSDIVIASASGSNVGIGVADPKSKLQVNGGVQIADDADGASADKVGTFKYYTATILSFDYSYVDMCMQTDTATYEWVNIITNRWAN